MNLTAELLRRVLRYDADIGVFIALVDAPNRPAGAIVGTQSAKGYLHARVYGRDYLLHRLAWLYVHGVWPMGQIDHRNGIRSDNRLENLRDVSGSVNQQNRLGANRNNQSCGLLGVTRADSGRWIAQITAHGRHRSLGRFDTPEQAHTAYLAAKARLHQGGDA